MKTPILPRIRRRTLWYSCSGALFLWLVAMQAGCLAMRTPDRQWAGKLQAKGQALPPVFLDIPLSGSRTIHAVYVGATDSLPLTVCVHGSPGSADAFLPYLADTILTRVSRVVTLDRPGFGYTSGFGHPEGSLVRQAEVVHAVVQRLSPERQVVLVGHSLGGPVIARYAMDHPDKVAGLVLVAGSIDPAQEEHPWWQAAIDVPPLCWLIPKSFWASNREIKLLEQELRNMLPLWDKVRCPVTVVHAENDRLVPFANVTFARRMLAHSADYREVTMDKGDHFILWSRPDVVRNAVLGLPTFSASGAPGSPAN